MSRPRLARSVASRTRNFPLPRSSIQWDRASLSCLPWSSKDLTTDLRSLHETCSAAYLVKKKHKNAIPLVLPVLLKQTAKRHGPIPLQYPDGAQVYCLCGSHEAQKSWSHLLEALLPAVRHHNPTLGIVVRHIPNNPIGYSRQIGTSSLEDHIFLPICRRLLSVVYCNKVKA